MLAELNALSRDGYVLVPAVFPADTVAAVRLALDAALLQYADLHQQLGYTNAEQGGAHHVLAKGGVFLETLSFLSRLDWLTHYLRSKLVINSYGGFDNRRDRKLYVRNIHRDIRFFSTERPLMLNLLVMIDDFTIHNGATHLLPGSHRQEQQPDDALFYARAERAVGRSGDLLVFDSRLWHAAGHNETDGSRRALTITLTSPFFKPQFDYCRALGDSQCQACSDEVKQLLGYYARIPATLSEWYQPADKRFYRGDQDHVT
ncbi:hypothetical protein HPT27_13585 [Permianibacter sp. IMCC34836]|uniref:phytanoyl-CoA dioxygenase family protein n=1 Tax=Permianibacter fluminis TaxID=2738515 RepID=UPI0015561820|nr:phytanoyl-CoA dioxygenase family protein [Permianibacter fluminis]NQD38059.1 hypothetical protein [Permianibacter fluminis]